MIRKLTLAIVTCPTSSILIQNHSAFHEYFANKRQIKASLSLEIVKKTSRDRMQRPKKVCDRMLPRSNFPVPHIHYSELFGKISENFDFRFHSHCSCIVMRSANQIGNWNPLSQSLSRRPTADKEPEKLWARDCYDCNFASLVSSLHRPKVKTPVT